MKKLLFFVMALAVVAFALPALAQPNNINGLGSYGNTIGTDSDNNQFTRAKIGDQSTGTALNKSSVTVNDNGSRNIDNSDNSTGTALNKSSITVENSFNDLGSGNSASFDDNSFSTFMNKSTLTVDGVGNANVIGNQNTSLTANITASGSLNNNTLYFGPMTTAWQLQYAYTHTYDHQLDFNSTFANSNSAAVFIPVNNNHLSQTNSGIQAQDHAGQLTAASSNAFNCGAGSITGVFGMSLNAGGVAQNQAAANVVTAFSR